MIDMSDSNRARDLVLAPNEYAYISDMTKGNINVYVGPYKTSLANTDKPVIFNPETKRFQDETLEKSIQIFSTAPEGWYIVLKNPEVSGKQPVNGTPSSFANLNIGRKVNIPGPVCFALWPGQMTRIVQGHHLRFNQYLLVRIYDEIEAKENWNKAVVKVKGSENQENIEPQGDIPELTIGKLLIIKGCNVSFYIPPTGVEVVRDPWGAAGYEYVREAVTLEQMEYCILKDENGEKKFHRGPNVVFPQPTEEFVEIDGMRKFKAIELNELSGLYIKVLAPYAENGRSFSEGEEIFITGKDQMIYYPRPEHAIIKYGNNEKVHAIAIPAGEGRYCLNRKTGTVSLKVGPCMFLPDPREEVLVRRMIEPYKVQLWFPGNEDALRYNQILKEMADQQRYKQLESEDNAIASEDYELAEFSNAPAALQSRAEEAKDKSYSKKYAGEKLERLRKFTPPRSITLDTKYDGAVSINVWTGYAVLITGKTGERKVIVGPQSYLLEYHEDLQTVELSQGQPKDPEKKIKTVYLRVLNNKVSDIISTETADYCNINVSVVYRLNFEGDPENWFNVENYVLFLCEHMRSLIRNLAKKHSVTDFYANGINLIRDTVLGVSEDGNRKGRVFRENGMRVYDLEVLDMKLEDNGIENLLISAQQNVVRQHLQTEELKRSADFETTKQEFERKIADTKNQTEIEKLNLKMAFTQKNLESDLKNIESDRQRSTQTSQISIEKAKLDKLLSEINLAIERSKLSQKIELTQKELDINILDRESQTNAIVNKANAFTPDLIAALQAFGDKALAEKLAESMAPLSIIGGKSIVEVFAQLVKGTSLQQYFDQKQSQNND